MQKPKPRDVVYNSLKITQLKSKELGFKAIKSLPITPVISHRHLWFVQIWGYFFLLLITLYLRNYISQAPLLTDFWARSAKGTHLGRNWDRKEKSLWLKQKLFLIPAVPHHPYLMTLLSRQL